MELSNGMRFMLETSLEERGGNFVEASQDWGGGLLGGRRGKRLITGQNFEGRRRGVCDSYRSIASACT